MDAHIAKIMRREMDKQRRAPMGMLYKRGKVLAYDALVRTRAFPSSALSRVQ